MIETITRKVVIDRAAMVRATAPFLFVVIVGVSTA
jgi:hypothetical protein